MTTTDKIATKQVELTADDEVENNEDSGRDTIARDSAVSLYKVYEEHSRTFRTWMVAYGIGSPAVMLTNESLARAFTASPAARLIVILFLIGVIAQVCLSFINKTIMWINYNAAQLDIQYGDSRRWHAVERAANWLSDRYSIDFIVDLISIVAFALATGLTMDIFLP